MEVHTFLLIDFSFYVDEVEMNRMLLEDLYGF